MRLPSPALLGCGWLCLAAAASAAGPTAELVPPPPPIPRRRRAESSARSARAAASATRGGPRPSAEREALTVPTPSTPSLAPRGGSGPSGRGGALLPSFRSHSTEVASALALVALDVALRLLFSARGIKFPVPLAGCVLLFSVMVLAELLVPGLGDGMYSALRPGAALIGRWLAAFFVPGLAMLPLAPSVGGAVEVAKVLVIVVLGFFFSLGVTTYAVLGLRRLQGAIAEPEAEPATAAADAEKPAAPPPPAPKPKPYTADTLNFLVRGAVLCGAASIAASRTDQPFKKPARTAFLGFATLASFVWGARFPPSVTNVLNPLLTSTLVTLLVIKLTGAATGKTFEDALRSYKRGSLHPAKAGAGDVLLYLLGPAVLSFAVGMYGGKAAMAANLPAIVLAALVSSLGGLFGTAAFARLINLGGSDGALLRRSVVPRSVSAALGMLIADILGGDAALATSVIILTGMFAAMAGVKTLDAWGVRDPVSRGLGQGSAGLNLGTAAIREERDAFPFAALAMVLTAVTATALTTVPVVAELLIKVAGGTPEVVAEAAAEATAQAAAA